MHSDILYLDEQALSAYRSLPDSGVRENYIGLFSGTPKFSYYETFTLSLYDGQGYGYILDQVGDILLRSVPVTGSRLYGNVFDALTDNHSSQEKIDKLAAALKAQETGSILFDGDSGRYIYTYASLDSVDEWCLLSIVPENAISAEADAILQYSQTSLTILGIILFICTLFVVLIWRTQQNIRERDKAIAYQEQLFDIFSTYLASNANGVYIMLDHTTEKVEYISPNAERVFGVKPEDLVDYIHAADLAEVIDEINTIVRPQARAKNQSFDIFVSHLKYEHLMGDKMRINQILINLLSNAVKYTQEGGTIQLRVEELSQVIHNYSRIRFTVSDNGLGMSEEYQKVIFEPFTREETRVTHEIQGTGLGMAITKSLVDLMGGAIRVESLLGEGSTFTVELELCIQEQEDDPNFWAEHKIAKMIVTDDDEEVCRGIVHAMTRVGVVTDYATDGETAVQMMREHREAGHPYDLILLDWKMPTLDGLETARLIRQNYPDKIPILLLTAYDWSEIEAEAKEVGISHFLPKPFFMSTFKEAIRRVIGSRKLEEDSETDVVRGRHILVVDDIEVNRIILVKILTSLGAQCDTAANGREAVDAFERSQPGEYDLILMDVQMPVMDGFAATRAIRGSSHPAAADIPIVAMTANAFVDDVRDAINAGMDAHIAKPVQIDKLKSTIQQVLNRRQDSAG